MSIRREIYQGLIGDGSSIIPVDANSSDRLRRELETARNAYDLARANMLEHDLARFYRVAIFGSARSSPQSPEFLFIFNLTKALVKARNLDIVTGGGPGIMESAFSGVQSAIDGAGNDGNTIRSQNHANRIELTTAERAEIDYAHVQTVHPEFSTRLQEFLDKTRAAYVAPGGIGTLLELSMVIQAMQVGHIEPQYPILVHPVWKPIIDTWNNTLYQQRVENGLVPFISFEDLELVHFTDNIPEIVSIISQNYDSWRKEIRDRVRYARSRRGQSAIQFSPSP